MDTLALYRQMTDDELLLVLRAFELDAAQPGCHAECQKFIAGRVAIIQAEITRRTQYLAQEEPKRETT